MNLLPQAFSYIHHQKNFWIICIVVHTCVKRLVMKYMLIVLTLTHKYFFSGTQVEAAKQECTLTLNITEEEMIKSSLLSIALYLTSDEHHNGPAKNSIAGMLNLALLLARADGAIMAGDNKLGGVVVVCSK